MPDSQISELSRFAIEPVDILDRPMMDQTPNEFDFAAHIGWAHDEMGTDEFVDDDTMNTDLIRSSSVPGVEVDEIPGVDVGTIWRPHAGFEERLPDARKLHMYSRNLGDMTSYTEMQATHDMIIAHPVIFGREGVTEDSVFKAIGIFSSAGKLAVFGQTPDKQVVELLNGEPQAAQRFGWGMFQGLTNVHQHVL